MKYELENKIYHEVSGAKSGHVTYPGLGKKGTMWEEKKYHKYHVALDRKRNLKHETSMLISKIFKKITSVFKKIWLKMVDE